MKYLMKGMFLAALAVAGSDMNGLSFANAAVRGAETPEEVEASEEPRKPRRRRRVGEDGDLPDRPKLPRDFHVREYKRGDGSQPSHAYDYVIDELTELRAKIASTEEEFGHESPETQKIMSRVRLLEQIRRNAKMLDHGMPKEEFEELVENMTRQAELRMEDRMRMHKIEEDGGSFRGGNNEDEQTSRKERQEELQTLGKAIREAKDHWRIIPKPMTHEASAEQKAEIMEVYEKIQASRDKAERKVLREKLDHLQTLIHDVRRHRDMDDEDKQKIKELREKSVQAETEEEKREIRDEIESLYRAHRKAKREANGRGARDRPQNYRDTDEQLIQLHKELEEVDTREDRKAIRKKIRDRLTELRQSDPNNQFPDELREARERRRNRDRDTEPERPRRRNPPKEDTGASE